MKIHPNLLLFFFFIKGRILQDLFLITTTRTGSPAPGWSSWAPLGWASPASPMSSWVETRITTDGASTTAASKSARVGAGMMGDDAGLVADHAWIV